VFSAVARGNELALLGTFRSINGQPRRHIAVLDARSGQLDSWIPWLWQKPIGQGSPHIVFAGTRLVAGVQGAVVAWREGASNPVWTRSYVYRGAVPEIASWRGTILAASAFGLYGIDPSGGQAHLADPGFRWSEFQTIGGHLTYSAQGSYSQYDPPRNYGVPCGQDVAATSVAVALTGTSTMVYVAVGPIDIESSNPPPTKIFACNWSSGVQPATFKRPSLAGVGVMAVVGSHLLVFTDGR
jgi:hypothetical protein